MVRALDDAGIAVDDVELRRPSLDDVFFALTGRPAEPTDTTDDPPLGEPPELARPSDLQGAVR